MYAVRFGHFNNIDYKYVLVYPYNLRMEILILDHCGARQNGLDMRISNTVFPRIVSAETILFWKLDCDHYSREETIQGRKLLSIRTF